MGTLQEDVCKFMLISCTSVPPSGSFIFNFSILGTSTGCENLSELSLVRGEGNVT